MINFINDPDDRFTCPICKTIFNEPWQTSCGHRFCKTCLESLFREKSLLCPVDGEQISQDECFYDKYCEREILNLRCSCQYRDRNCDWTGEFRNLGDHEVSCLYGDVQCQGCGETVERRNLEEHRLKICVNRAVMCSYCGGNVRQNNMKDHLEICQKFPVTCHSLCGKETIPRDMLDAHVTAECPEAEVLCPFSVHGCEFKGKRKFIEEHLKTAIKAHVEKMNESSVENQKKYAQLEEKVDLLEKEKNTQDQQLQNQSKQLEAARINIQAQQNKIDLIERSTSYSGVYLWKIDQYSRRFQEAVSGKTTSIYSPPFYVGRFGYKVCARLYLNGDGMAKGTHLSVFIVIMRGEYDSLLPWPFRQEVKLRIIDQDKIRDAIVAFRPDPDSSSFKRPTSEMNIASGCPTLLPHTELRQGGFVRDDIMFVKINIDMRDLQGDLWTS